MTRKPTLSFSMQRKQLAILIDPDGQSPMQAGRMARMAGEHGADFIFLGGSLVVCGMEDTLAAIKSSTDLPVILFPGHYSQLSPKLDAVLFISLISGRNADYLIGNHVIAAPQIKRMRLPVIPCGYILIESGQMTSVEYMSNTRPIPASKTDIVVATAMAGEMLGNSCIYLEGGSGAQERVRSNTVSAVKNAIGVPLIVGGGIRTPQDLLSVYEAGADVAVIGTAVEQNPELIPHFCKIKSSVNKK